MEIDVTSVEPVAAFCSSDEEVDDSKVLEFLPIAPDVEDPEDGPGSTSAPVTSSPPSKTTKYKSFDIQLEGAACQGRIQIFINPFFYRGKL